MRCKNKSVNLTVVDCGGGFNLYCISKCFDFHAHLGSIPIFFLLSGAASHDNPMCQIVSHVRAQLAQTIGPIPSLPMHTHVNTIRRLTILLTYTLTSANGFDQSDSKKQQITTSLPVMTFHCTGGRSSHVSPQQWCTFKVQHIRKDEN